MSSYDKEKFYDDKIAPLMEQIIETCLKEGIHMISAFYLKDAENEDDRLFCTTYIPGEVISERIEDMYHAMHGGNKRQEETLTAVTIADELVYPPGTGE